MKYKNKTVNLPRGSHSKSIPFTLNSLLVSDIISGQSFSRKGKSTKTLSKSLLIKEIQEKEFNH